MYRPGTGVLLPHLIKEARPKYPKELLKAGVSGTIELEAVVQTDGKVGQVRVIRSLNPKLDEEAMKAVRKFRFTPGSKDGVPVPVVIEVEMNFSLK